MSFKKRIYGVKLPNTFNECFYCGCSLSEFDKTIDHVIPKSRGGILSKRNKVVACSKCNRLKGNMTPEEFLMSLNSMEYMITTKYKVERGYITKVKKSVEWLIQQKKKNK